jgi:hypothetical protein
MTNYIEKEILKDVLNNPGDTFYENVLSDFLDEQGIEHDFRKPLHNDKIEKVKLCQKKYLDVWINHWISVGLCTKPTNESKAEQYFYDFYNQLGFPNPKSIIWCNNPIEMCSQLSNWSHGLNHVWNRIWSQIKDQVKGQVWDQVWNQVCNQVWNRVRNQVEDLVRSQTWNLTRGLMWNQVWRGQQDAHWLAFFAYIMQVLRVEVPKLFVPYMLLAQEINWWLSTEQAVYIVRKPKEYVFEDGKFVKLIYQDDYILT